MFKELKPLKGKHINVKEFSTLACTAGRFCEPLSRKI